MKTGFISVAFVIAACAWVPSAHSLYRCDSQSLSTTDQRRLENAAADAVGSRGVQRGTEWYCRSSDSASARLETEHVTNADGSMRWAELYCRRGRVRWSCESTERRSLEVPLELAGNRRGVAALVPVDMDVSTARAILIQTLNLALSPTAVATPSCSANVYSGLLRDGWAQSYLRGNDFLELAVGDDGEQLTLTNAGVVLEFVRAESEPSPRYELRCWSERIIVTG